MNLPNSITVARVLLVPVFLVLAYEQTPSAAIAALVVFLVASLSDSLDGYLARRSNQITRFGQFLDPTADKLLIGAALYSLVELRSFPLWAAIVIAIREVAVQVLRTRIVHAGDDLPASPAGKAKTTLQVVMISWWLLPWEEAGPVHWGLLAAAVATTVISGFEYFKKARAVA